MEQQVGIGASGLGRPVDVIHPLRAESRFAPRPTLPPRQTGFVGRAMELAELAELLAAPTCRLVTIIGPGGIGKTRLALEVAEAARLNFADGVAYAPLQALAAGESIAPALAVAIGCPLTGKEEARDHVARFLAPLHLLLVLDNFEHLLDEATWLADLLAAAPGLRLIATSREVLNLREEWRYPLAGLTVPAEETETAAVGGADVVSDALRLFDECARRVRPDFDLSGEREEVARICRLTEGLPLAIELAAAWVRTLPCAAIADEIERNIAFLATDLRNVPARHRSMRAVFDHSWALLTDYEQHIFRRLVVFRGGFSREAAGQVAGATLPLLSSLVDKSLVRYDAEGRFHLHELLRQYADEHLQAAPEAAVRAYTAHRAYYLSFLAERTPSIVGGNQREAMAAVAAELDNVRAAWRAAVDTGDAANLSRGAHGLALFHDFRARYREGLALLEAGVRSLRAAAPSPEIERALAAILVDVARMHHRLGQMQAMRAVLAEAEARYALFDYAIPPGQMTDPLVWQGILALIDGNYAEAERLGAEAVRRNTAEDRPSNLPLAWWVRAGAALWQEELEAAGDFARRGAEASLAVGDRWHLAYGRNQQGHVAAARGAFAEARRHYEAGLAIREEFEDPEGVGTGFGHLANVAARQEDWAEAERLYQLSLAIAREIGDRAAQANALNGLGRAASASGDLAAAGRYLAEGLDLVIQARFLRFLISYLVSTGDWLLQTGKIAEAIESLTLARDHSASNHENRSAAQRLLNEAAQRAQDVQVEAIASAHSSDPILLAQRLVTILSESTVPAISHSTPVPDDAPRAAPSPGPASAAPPGLVEPLSERELAVLRLIAAGHSNREIADELFLALNTVRSYSHQLYGKLGVSSRTQAIARARELNLLD